MYQNWQQWSPYGMPMGQMQPYLQQGLSSNMMGWQNQQQYRYQNSQQMMGQWQGVNPAMAAGSMDMGMPSNMNLSSQTRPQYSAPITSSNPNAPTGTGSTPSITGQTQTTVTDGTVGKQDSSAKDTATPTSNTVTSEIKDTSKSVTANSKLDKEKSEQLTAETPEEAARLDHLKQQAQQWQAQQAQQAQWQQYHYQYQQQVYQQYQQHQQHQNPQQINLQSQPPSQQLKQQQQQPSQQPFQQQALPPPPPPPPPEQEVQKQPEISQLTQQQSKPPTSQGPPQYSYQEPQQQSFFQQHQQQQRPPIQEQQQNNQNAQNFQNVQYPHLPYNKPQQPMQSPQQNPQFNPQPNQFQSQTQNFKQNTNTPQQHHSIKQQPYGGHSQQPYNQPHNQQQQPRYPQHVNKYVPPSQQSFQQPPSQMPQSRVPSSGSTSGNGQAANTPVVVDDSEDIFDKQFREWDKQFEEWRERNKYNPDRAACQQYELQYQQMREQLLQKREHMRILKEQAKQKMQVQERPQDHPTEGKKIIDEKWQESPNESLNIDKSKGISQPNQTTSFPEHKENITPPNSYTQNFGPRNPTQIRPQFLGDQRSIGHHPMGPRPPFSGSHWNQKDSRTTFLDREEKKYFGDDKDYHTFQRSQETESLSRTGSQISDSNDRPFQMHTYGHMTDEKKTDKTTSHQDKVDDFNTQTKAKDNSTSGSIQISNDSSGPQSKTVQLSSNKELLMLNTDQPISLNASEKGNLGSNDKRPPLHPRDMREFMKRDRITAGTAGVESITKNVDLQAVPFIANDIFSRINSGTMKETLGENFNNKNEGNQLEMTSNINLSQEDKNNDYLSLIGVSRPEFQPIDENLIAKSLGIDNKSRPLTDEEQALIRKTNKDLRELETLYHQQEQLEHLAKLHEIANQGKKLENAEKISEDSSFSSKQDLKLGNDITMDFSNNYNRGRDAENIYGVGKSGLPSGLGREEIGRAEEHLGMGRGRGDQRLNRGRGEDFRSNRGRGKGEGRGFGRGRGDEFGHGMTRGIDHRYGMESNMGRENEYGIGMERDDNVYGVEREESRGFNRGRGEGRGRGSERGMGRGRSNDRGFGRGRGENTWGSSYDMERGSDQDLDMGNYKDPAYHRGRSGENEFDATRRNEFGFGIGRKEEYEFDMGRSDQGFGMAQEEKQFPERDEENRFNIERQNDHRFSAGRNQGAGFDFGRENEYGYDIEREHEHKFDVPREEHRFAIERDGQHGFGMDMELDRENEMDAEYENERGFGGQWDRGRGRGGDRGRSFERGRRTGMERNRGHDRGRGLDRGRGSDRGRGFERGRGQERGRDVRGRGRGDPGFNRGNNWKEDWYQDKYQEYPSSSNKWDDNFYDTSSDEKNRWRGYDENRHRRDYPENEWKQYDDSLPGWKKEDTYLRDRRGFPEQENILPRQNTREAHHEEHKRDGAVSYDYGHRSVPLQKDYQHCSPSLPPGQRDPYSYSYAPPSAAASVFSLGQIKTIDYGHGQSSNKSEVVIDYGHERPDGENVWSKKSELEQYSYQSEQKPMQFKDIGNIPSKDRTFDSERDRGRPRERETEKNTDRSRSREDFRIKDERDREKDRERERPRDEMPKSRDFKLFPAVDSKYGDSPFHRNEPKPETVLIEDLLSMPGRKNRPSRIVIILRGPPGSGKTFVAKLIKDKEMENGGNAPRMLCIDDYFMIESEKMEKDPETGKRIKIKSLEYEYEPEMEKVYQASLVKVFKKTIENGFFPFIIVDAVHDKCNQFEEMWSFAKQNGIQVYIAELDMDAALCHKRNIHNRSLADITKIIKKWEQTPRHYLRVDIRSLLQDAAIPEVEMEDFVEEKEDKKKVESKPSTPKVTEKTDHETGLVLSRWEQMEATDEKLDKLDGLRSMKRRRDEPQSLEDYLQLPDDYELRSSQPGKKRVRWADVEEQKVQDHRRALGFVIGQTDWDKITDPLHAERALTKTKYI